MELLKSDTWNKKKKQEDTVLGILVALLTSSLTGSMISSVV